MKKCRILSLLALVILLSLTACGNKEPIQIGIVGTMSGSSSDLAVTGRRGVELAVKEINKDGGIDGRMIELVIKDDKNDPEVAISLVDAFVDEDVQLVIGHYTSGMMTAVVDKVNSANVLYLGPTVSADELSGRDDHFLRFIASTKEQAQVLTSVANDFDHKKFVVVIDEKNEGFNKALYNNFAENLTAVGGEVLATYYYTELSKVTLDEICEASCDAGGDGMFIISNASDFSLFAQKFYKNDSKMQLYGPLWAHTSDLLMFGGEAVEDAFIVGAVDYESVSVEFNRVNLLYKATYGSDMTFSSMYSYETLMAIRDAIVRGDSDQWNDVKTNIIEIGTFEGLQDNYTIDGFGDNSREYIVERVVEGNYKRIK